MSKHKNSPNFFNMRLIIKPSTQSRTRTKGGNTRGENPRDWAKKTNDIVEW